MEALKTVLYFSLFQYPLTIDEIFSFSNLKHLKDVKDEINDLTAKEIIFKIESFYMFEKKPELIERRIRGNKAAENIFNKADKMSKFISKFPFVEGVGISGSLSKGYYDPVNGDIDFFVITKEDRLWLARTILVLYKKLFLLNSRKYFCVNYFVSENSLEINEKNRFTATELVTLIPMYNNNCFAKFYKQNQWAYDMIPNREKSKSFRLKTIQKTRVIKYCEYLFKGFLGDLLDQLFLNLTQLVWKVKFRNMESKSFKVAMKSTKDVSKHHPQNFQKQVIEMLNIKYSAVNKLYNLNIPMEHD